MKAVSNMKRVIDRVKTIFWESDDLMIGYSSMSRARANQLSRVFKEIRNCEEVGGFHLKWEGGLAKPTRDELISRGYCVAHSTAGTIVSWDAPNTARSNFLD